MANGMHFTGAEDYRSFIDYALGQGANFPLGANTPGLAPFPSYGDTGGILGLYQQYRNPTSTPSPTPPIPPPGIAPPLQGGGGLLGGLPPPATPTTPGSLQLNTGEGNTMPLTYDPNTPQSPAFDIPTSLYPKTTTKLYPWAEENLKQLMPQLTSPGAFAQSYRPIFKDLTRNIISGQARKGILPSTVTEQALTEAAKIPYQGYLNQMMGAGQLLSGMKGATYENPLAPYELMSQLLMNW